MPETRRTACGRDRPDDCSPFEHDLVAPEAAGCCAKLECLRALAPTRPIRAVETDLGGAAACPGERVRRCGIDA